MRATSHRIWVIRIAIALLLVLSLMVVALTATLPTMHLRADVAAFDDDDDDDGGELDEGDDDDGGGDDSSGQGSGDDDGDDEGDGDDGDDDGDDDEGDFVTAVPTEKSEPRSEPTRPALTPAPSPTSVATGSLLIRLLVCPTGTDPAVGTDALAEECTVGKADADFELSGRSGLYDGWRRTVTTTGDGDARIARLAEGTYNLTLSELDWCAAEASAVDNGLIAIEPGETTEVTAYLCDDPDDTTPAGS